MRSQLFKLITEQLFRVGQNLALLHIDLFASGLDPTRWRALEIQVSQPCLVADRPGLYGLAVLPQHFSGVHAGEWEIDLSNGLVNFIQELFLLSKSAYLLLTESSSCQGTSPRHYERRLSDRERSHAGTTLALLVSKKAHAMSRWWRWITASLALLIAVVVGVSFFIDQPLRRMLERKLNTNLQGYTARLGAVDFHPLDFSLELRNLVIVQNAHPELPVLSLPKLSASVQWRALFAGRLVADFLLEQMAIYVNRKQTQKEIADKVSVQDRGWQQALESIYPLKINEFRIKDGSVTYVDDGPFPPLQIRQLNLRAGNIRNVWSPEHVYPSNLHLEGQVFDSGELVLDGHANFLAEPHVALNVQLTLKQIELQSFRPLLARQNIRLRNGVLTGTGRMEYAPHIQVFDLQALTIEGVHLTYIHTEQSAPKEQKATQKTVHAAQQANNNPTMFVRADQLDITKSTFAFENKEVNPPYRLFWTDAECHLSNFTNHLTEGTMVGKLTGKLMGWGATAVGATFRPETNGPDFALAVRIEPTPMRELNKLWRAYGDFDVVGGLFSLYTELKVKNGAISGYVKPLFKDVDALDRRQDKDKGIVRKVYEGLIGGISWLLENRPHEEVATVTPVSGKLENPQTSTAQAILGLVQNAFFKAILPGFENAVGHPTHLPEQARKTLEPPSQDKTMRKAREMAAMAKKQPNP